MNPEDPQGPSLDVFADDLSDKEHTKRFGRTVDEFARHFHLGQNELYALIRATIDGLGVMPDPMRAALVAAGRASEVYALEHAVNACFFGGVQRGGVYVELGTSAPAASASPSAPESGSTSSPAAAPAPAPASTSTSALAAASTSVSH